MGRPFRLPAEWHRQSGAMLAWPHPATDWSGNLEDVQRVYLRIALEIARRQPLLIICRDPSHQAEVEGKLRRVAARRENLLFTLIPYNDTWIRDNGPLACTQGDRARLRDFRFDGWGGKYPADLDDRITRTLATRGVLGETPLQRTGLTLEGGAVETDGAGTLLATLSSVVDERRNPGLGRREIEEVLQRELGLTRFLWLHHGSISGDDSDGHIDTLARFTDPHTIVHTTALPDDGDFPELRRMAAELGSFRQADGSPYRLLPLPPIPPLTDADGRRLPASYANFLVINGAVLIPVYGVPADDAAATLLEECFPGRDVVTVDCRPLIIQNGSLHCVTLQFPAELAFPPASGIRP